MHVAWRCAAAESAGSSHDLLLDGSGGRRKNAPRSDVRIDRSLEATYTDVLSPDNAPTLALLIFALTYLTIALGELPRLRLDRPGAALAGAGLVLALGVVPPARAYAAVNLPTLTLLLGMMVIAGYLRAAGLLRWIAEAMLRLARGPRGLLWMTVLLSGALSALFVNDTVCLFLTPVLLLIVEARGLPPVPYLLAIAMGSNAGSVVTPVGNPQNMLIANLSGIPFREFSGRLFLPGVISLLVTGLVLHRIYGRGLAAAAVPAAAPAVREPHAPRRLAWLGAAVGFAVIAAMLAGVPPPIAAIGGAAALLLGAGIRPARVYAGVDWTLLLMFAGLFAVTDAVEATGWTRKLFDWILPFPAGPAPDAATPAFLLPFVAAVALLSNLFSNVPAVLMFKPLIQHLGSPRELWLLLSFASTLAGNLTLVGSVANLIVVQQSRHRVEITFREYLRVGPLAAGASLVLGGLWLWWVR